MREVLELVLVTVFTGIAADVVLGFGSLNVVNRELRGADLR